jgi:large subunit ribosomal protein L24
MSRIQSIQPRKQRKAAGQAPLHQRHKKLAAHMAEPLIIRYNRRSLPVVRGDTVKVMRGVYRGHEEKIASVDLKMQKVTVEGVTVVKADGTKVARAVDPSNLMITKLNLTDPRRRDRLARVAKVDEETRKKLAKELEAEAKAQEDEIRQFTERLAQEEAERKAKAREEGDLEAGIDPVTQEPVLGRRTEGVTEEPEDEEETPAEAPATKAGGPAKPAPPAKEKAPESKAEDEAPAEAEKTETPEKKEASEKKTAADKESHSKEESK